MKTEIVVRRNGLVTFDQGDTKAPLFVVLDGEIEAVHPRGADEVPIIVLGAREFTGDVGLLSDRPAVVRARAKTALTVLCVAAVGEGSVCIQLVQGALQEQLDSGSPSRSIPAARQ